MGYIVTVDCACRQGYRWSFARRTDTSCDYSLFAGIIRGFNIGLAAALLLSAVGMFAMRKRGRWAVAAPMLGLVIATVLRTECAKGDRAVNAPA